MTKPSVGPTWQLCAHYLDRDRHLRGRDRGLVLGAVGVHPGGASRLPDLPAQPPRGLVRQRGVRRTPAVIMAVLLATLALGSIGWLVTSQITSLIQELPRYTQTVKEKVRTFKKVTENSGQLKKMVTEINQELGQTTDRPAKDDAEESPGGETADSGLSTRRPTAVILEPQSPVWLSRLTSFLSPLLESLGELALAIILVIFMLLKREELRNRIIRLAGHGQIVVATKFVDEAGSGSAGSSSSRRSSMGRSA